MIASKSKLYSLLSLTLFLLGVISWVPYLIFNIQQPFGMLTFIVNPIGLYFGHLANSKLLALGNLFMLFSFIPVMIYVYLLNGYIPM